MKEVKISVIVSTYRRDNLLDRALKSLSNQTFLEFEVLVVDDNGDVVWNDKVKNIVNKYIHSLNVKLIINETNIGSALSRNIGINAAQGSYITFLDDDDIYLKDKLEKQYYAMIKADADYCITDLLLYDSNDRLVDSRIRKYIISNDKKELLRYHLLYHMTGTDTMMFKSTYLDKIGLFSPIDIGDEFYLMLKAINGNGSFLYLKGCSVKAYIHVGENEGLSSGDKKIAGENDLYKEKQKYHHVLSKKDLSYINVRHYLVIAFAELRRSNYFLFVKNVIKAFYNSPRSFISLLINR